MSSIGNLASGLLHAVLPSGLFPANTSASATSFAAQQQPEIGYPSSSGQLAGTLQKLQLSNPAQYRQVTQQIAANLQSAAQTAQASGNTAAVARLSRLSADFTNASASGQLPNLQHLASAVGGYHGYHHSASSGGSFSQILSSLQPGGQNSALSAANIIQNTLTSNGIPS